jgi:metal-sulfur cluster biosynthetic enzyme
MMRAAARLDGNESRRQTLEVADHLGTPELPVDYHDLGLVNAVELEDRLGGIHADADGTVHWTLLSFG